MKHFINNRNLQDDTNKKTSNRFTNFYKSHNPTTHFKKSDKSSGSMNIFLKFFLIIVFFFIVYIVFSYFFFNTESNFIFKFIESEFEKLYSDAENKTSDENKTSPAIVPNSPIAPTPPTPSIVQKSEVPKPEPVIAKSTNSTPPGAPKGYTIQEMLNMDQDGETINKYNGLSKQECINKGPADKALGVVSYDSGDCITLKGIPSPYSKPGASLYRIISMDAIAPPSFATTLGVGVGSQVGAMIALKGLSKTPIFKSVMSKVSSKVMSKMVVILNFKSVGKISKTVASATKMSDNILKKIGTTTAKLGAKTGLKTGSKIMSKVAKLLTPNPLDVLDILSIGLDMADVGGYAELGTKKMYIEQKKQSDTQFKQLFINQFKELSKEAGIDFSIDDMVWPIVIDPLSGLPEGSENEQIQAEVSKLLSLDEDNKEPLAKEFINAILEDLKNGKITIDGIANGSVDIGPYLEKVDMEALTVKAVNFVCTNNNGMVYDNDKCTLNESDCNKSYSWPMKENETYAEFVNGKCILADPTMKLTCHDAGLEYDVNTGICVIDEGYCKSKGADWKFDKKIQQYDCNVNVGQEIGEFILGTTITRGLKQVFDPQQYESCGYNVLKTKNGKCLEINPNNKDQVLLKDCTGKDNQTLFYNPRNKSISVRNSNYDYNKCIDIPNGNYAAGQELKTWDCNNSAAQKFNYYWFDNTVKPESNKKLCFENVNGVLTLNPCNGKNEQKFNFDTSGLIDAGYTCTINQNSRVADCPDGYTNNGATCGRGASSKSSDLGHGAYKVADCGKNATNFGLTCSGTFKRDTWTTPFADNKGRCEARWGKGNCQDVVTGWGEHCVKSAIRQGYSNPTGYVNMGIAGCAMTNTIADMGVCSDPNYPKLSGGLCYSDCQKKYGNGYYNNGTSCWRDVSTLGMGSMTCKPNEFKTGARCYKKCPPGFTNNGEWCGKTKTRSIQFGSPSKPLSRTQEAKSKNITCSGLSSAYSYNTGSLLYQGQTLLQCDGLKDSSGTKFLVLQSNGALSIYDSSSSKWANVSNTEGKGKAPFRLKYQTDGNLVLYDGDNVATWSTGTANKNSNVVALQSDGNLVMFNNNDVIWSIFTVAKPSPSQSYDGYKIVPPPAATTCTGNKGSYTLKGDRLKPGEVLNSCEGLKDVKFNNIAVMQSDGNFVIYATGNGKAYWSTGTSGKGKAPYRLAYQTDSNLVLYDATNKALWSNKKFGKTSDTLIMQEDGNFVCYDKNKAIWSSKHG